MSQEKLIAAIESKFDAIIERVEGRITHLHADMKETIMGIKEELHGHTESDKGNFGSLNKSDDDLRAAMQQLTKGVTDLTAQVKIVVADGEANKKTFITWPWYIGTTITILSILGGLMGGIYMQLGGLTSRIQEIEFIANISQ